MSAPKASSRRLPITRRHALYPIVAIYALVGLVFGPIGHQVSDDMPESNTHPYFPDHIWPYPILAMAVLVGLGLMARIGQPLFAAQPPTGYPDDASSWLSSGALLARIDFGLALAGGQVEGVRVDLAPLAHDPMAPEEMLDRAAAQLGMPALSDRTRQYVLAQLRGASPRSQVLASRALGLLLGSPELQRR